MAALTTFLKGIVQNALYPMGSVAHIRRGPLRGCRYKVSAQSGWAPILGRWEPEAQAIYRQLVAPGECVWDLGANTGIHTLLFARLVGPTGHVVAFEPVEANVREIVETCRLNGVSNVSILRKAVSDASGIETFHVGKHDKQGSLVGIGRESGDRIEVSCTTLDAALDDHRRPDFIKIDIEGAESRALTGFSRCAETHATFAIDLHTPSEDEAVARWLAARGYRVFRLMDATARRALQAASMLAPIAHATSGWPDIDGVWGTVIAVHPSRGAKLEVAEHLCR